MRLAFFILLFFLSPVFLSAQVKDTVSHRPEGWKPSVATDSLVSKKPLPVFETGNRLLNDKAQPVSYAILERRVSNKDLLFYLLLGMVCLLALLRFFFARYYTNLFRVFFNSSLRQGQLTDQLLQAKLPSLLFNLFFIVSAGFYSYLLLAHYQWIDRLFNWQHTFICISILALAYGIKYSSLKFTGWLTGYTETVNTYIFIVFLISKIIGILLVPFVLMLAFSDRAIIQVSVTASLLLIGLLLALRFVRSYGVLQGKLKISRLHFLLYIFGAEILPLLLIYKGLMILLDKNL